MKEIEHSVLNSANKKSIVGRVVNLAKSQIELRILTQRTRKRLPLFYISSIRFSLFDYVEMYDESEMRYTHNIYPEDGEENSLLWRTYLKAYKPSVRILPTINDSNNALSVTDRIQRTNNICSKIYTEPSFYLCNVILFRASWPRNWHRTIDRMNLSPTSNGVNVSSVFCCNTKAEHIHHLWYD